MAPPRLHPSAPRGCCREEADAAHRRSKEINGLTAVLIITGVVTIVCIGVVVVPGSPPENAKWATTLLTAIVSGGLGYVLRSGDK